MFTTGNENKIRKTQNNVFTVAILKNSHYSMLDAGLLHKLQRVQFPMHITSDVTMVLFLTSDVTKDLLLTSDKY